MEDNLFTSTKQPLAGQKSNINKPVIDPVRDPTEKVSNGVDETTLFDYPVLVSFPRKRESRPANAGFEKVFLERFLLCSKEHIIAVSFGSMMPAKKLF
jgi:hypothetical protein